MCFPGFSVILKKILSGVIIAKTARQLRPWLQQLQRDAFIRLPLAMTLPCVFLVYMNVLLSFYTFAAELVC